MLALAASGYRVGRERPHERTILSLNMTVAVPSKTVDLLDTVRRKRNQSNYERVGRTSDAEASELYQVVVALRIDVAGWLARYHPAPVAERRAP